MVKVRTSIYSCSELDNGVSDFKEAQNFAQAALPYLFGKKLKAILITYFGLSEQTKTMSQLKSLCDYIKERGGVVSWSSDIVFLIGDELLAIELWAPWKFKLGLNTLLIDKVVENPNLRAPINYLNEFGKILFNISEAYGEDIIGHKIVNIMPVAYGDDNDDESCVAFMIELDNHQQIKVFEDCDDVYIETIPNVFKK